MRVLMRFLVQNGLTLPRTDAFSQSGDCKEKYHLLVEDVPPSNFFMLTWRGFVTVFRRLKTRAE